MDLKEESILGNAIDNHWYYKNKASAVVYYLRGVHYQKIMDVGAGSGFFTRYLLAHTNAESGLCVDISYPDERDVLVAEKPIRYRKSCGEEDVDLVLLMDVLEHVDDDVGLLQEYVAKVPSGTYFLITVPAFQFLWSRHDIFLEHRRRYTLGYLDKVTLEAGLKLEYGSYYFGAIFPIAAGIRLGEKLLGSPSLEPESGLKIHTPFINYILSTLCRIERPIMRWNRLVGLSVFCLCRKP
jgi:SAM-dependent methyltransferase